MKSVGLPEVFNYIQLSTVVNTSEYKLNLFGNKLIVCSNDALHRFQLEKIQVQDYELPLPFSAYRNCSIHPIFTLANEKNSTDFLMIFREEQLDSEKQMDEVEVYFASFSNKYLFKKFDLASITLSY
jgi:hypothetical protein